MGLSDIFDTKGTDDTDDTDDTAEPIVQTPVTGLAGAAIGVPDKIATVAQEAAQAADGEVSAALRYKTAKARLQAEMDTQLAPLKEELTSAREAAKKARETLLDTMDTAGITKVPMPDRKPIQIKTKLGAKKSITKTWLKSTLGEEKAEALWDQVPRQPDSQIVNIPRPFDDQPND